MHLLLVLAMALGLLALGGGWRQRNGRQQEQDVP